MDVDHSFYIGPCKPTTNMDYMIFRLQWLLHVFLKNIIYLNKNICNGFEVKSSKVTFHIVYLFCSPLSCFWNLRFLLILSKIMYFPFNLKIGTNGGLVVGDFIIEYSHYHCQKPSNHVKILWSIRHQNLGLLSNKLEQLNVFKLANNVDMSYFFLWI